MEKNMDRSEHMAWCKKRALAFVEIDDIQQAYMSMVSDLQKHAGTVNHVGIEMGMMLMVSGNLKTPLEMRNFIEGFG
jgi:hypothetical protein